MWVISSCHMMVPVVEVSLLVSEVRVSAGSLSLPGECKTLC